MLFVMGDVAVRDEMGVAQRLSDTGVVALSAQGERLWEVRLPGYEWEKHALLTDDALYVASVVLDHSTMPGRDVLILSKLSRTGQLLWQARRTDANLSLSRLKTLGLELDPSSARPTLFAIELEHKANGPVYGKTSALSFDPNSGAADVRVVPLNRSFEPNQVKLVPGGEWLIVGRAPAYSTWNVALQFRGPALELLHEFSLGGPNAEVNSARAEVSAEGEIAIMGSVHTGTVFDPDSVFQAGGYSLQGRDVQFLFLLGH